VIAACGSKPTPGVLTVTEDADEARMQGVEVRSKTCRSATRSAFRS
jgi:hypothetical protein